MTFDKEFKKAISHLPSLEKDKLILRLLRKDLNLANRLHFELIDTRSVDERRDIIQGRIISGVKQISSVYYTPGYLMMEMRYLSGEITDHVKITKDKYGEASLNLLMLNETLKSNNDTISHSSQGKTKKLCVYIIARAFKIIILINKLHEDFLIDFNKDLQKLGELISANDHLMRSATQNGFDIYWLLDADIPENIEKKHRDIRSQGYLSSHTYLRMPDYNKEAKKID